MPTQRTLAIVKPDGVRRDLIGKIITRIEDAELSVIAAKLIHMSRVQAEGFYAVHSERPFFGSLVDFMTSGPSMVMVLEGESAIGKWRDMMGATNPDDAAEGTIRKDFAESLEANTTHGSDAPETAAFETSWFFAGTEFHSRK